MKFSTLVGAAEYADIADALDIASTATLRAARRLIETGDRSRDGTDAANVLAAVEFLGQLSTAARAMASPAIASSVATSTNRQMDNR